MNQKVSLQDVAKAAGVSAMTVSRVINNHPRVLAKTAEKVQAVIKDLGTHQFLHYEKGKKK